MKVVYLKTRDNRCVTIGLAASLEHATCLVDQLQAAWEAWTTSGDILDPPPALHAAIERYEGSEIFAAEGTKRWHLADEWEEVKS